jgi:hypothetical protein
MSNKDNPSSAFEHCDSENGEIQMLLSFIHSQLKPVHHLSTSQNNGSPLNLENGCPQFFNFEPSYSGTNC